MIPEWIPKDSRVFNVFLRDGPLEIASVAAQLGLSYPACWNAVNELTAAGVLVVIHRRRQGSKPVRIYDVKGR
jgi:DNA-binding Lrp family transcriptional regulator